LFGGVPIWIFNRALAGRQWSDRPSRIRLSLLLFGTAAILLAVLLALDGKLIGVGHVIFVVMAFVVAIVFGSVAEGPTEGPAALSD
jgi:peptidoglycan/LPS O-acetylase OafA/YrhL